MAKRGRPKLNTEKLRKAIIQSITEGTPETIAAMAAGINRCTLLDWKKKDPAFSSAIKAARAKAVQVRVKRIQTAAKGGAVLEEKIIKRKDGSKEVIRKHARPEWQADAWYLERQFCELFGLNRNELKELLRLVRHGNSKQN